MERDLKISFSTYWDKIQMKRGLSAKKLQTCYKNFTNYTKLRRKQIILHSRFISI